MFLMREPFWLLFITSVIGIYFGRMKGRPGWGLLLGFFFGPFGLALVLMLPARKAGRQTGGRPHGPLCPRCGKSVGRSDKACSHCGNLLVPIHYEVRGPENP